MVVETQGEFCSIKVVNTAERMNNFDPANTAATLEAVDRLGTSSLRRRMPGTSSSADVDAFYRNGGHVQVKQAIARRNELRKQHLL